MIYVVLGMHKSGTTLVSELLHKSGIDMVEKFDTENDYYSGNKVERAATLELNHQILGSKGVFSLDIQATNVKLELSDKHLVKMRQIIEDCNGRHEDWGFKDPRSCITYPLWADVLPAHKIITVYRHPYHVMNHYRKRVGILQRWSRARAAYDIWTDNNQNLLNQIKQATNPLLVLNYQDLMNKDQIFQGLSDFVQRPLHDARITGKKRNSLKPDFMFRCVDWLSKRRGMNVYRELESLKLK